MKKYELTNEDYENLKKLFIISKAIKHIYDKLIELEALDKKDSVEYQKILNLLNKSLLIEEEIYKNIGANPSKISELLFHILEYDQIIFEDCMEYIHKLLDSNMIKARIVLRLEKIIDTTEFTLEEIEEDDDLSIRDDSEEYSEIFLEVTNAEQQFFIMNNLEYEVEKDILNTILRILNEYIFNPDFQNIKKRLIQFKYLISFTFKTVELDFLENNFEISSELYWSSNILMNIYKEKKETLETIMSSYAGELLDRESDNLINLFFEDLKDLENYESAIISQIIIRACLLFVSDRTIKTFIDFILTELNNTELNNLEIIEIVKNALNKLQLDQELPIIINLKLDK